MSASRRSGRDTRAVDTQTSGRHSPDGSWWWSGAEWVPAWSGDRQWWFDGTVWTRTRRTRTFPKPSAVEYVIAGAWFLIWILALVWAAKAEPEANAGADPSSVVVSGGLVLGIGSVILLVVCGYLLAHAGRWVYMAGLTLYVWGLLLAWYVGAMLMTPATDGSDNDNAAGAGLVILGIPALFAVAVLVGLGAGAAAGARALARRHSQGVTPTG